MALNFYQFRSEWPIAAPADDVYRALEQLDDYPSWWHEIRTARRLDDDAYELTARSLLPYDLTFVTRQRRRDPEARVLEAELVGDLSGFSRWTIAPDPAGMDSTLAVFEEEVTANKALLRRLAPVARPAFRANHTLMMRSGRRGLSTYLAGWRRGQQLH